jgi:hypothetical protein
VGGTGIEPVTPTMSTLGLWTEHTSMDRNLVEMIRFFSCSCWFFVVVLTPDSGRNAPFSAPKIQPFLRVNLRSYVIARTRLPMM